MELYKKCQLCPCNCNIDRSISLGRCQESDVLSIANVMLHNGEEPCISYGNGSGTIFFTGCGLRCPFCQNMEISQTVTRRKYYSTEELIAIILKLEELGAANINFVTPDHFMPHIIEAVRYLKSQGFTLPFIYNCSGYQSVSHLEKVIDDIDIFLIDYKFADKNASDLCLHVTDYPAVAQKAIKFLMKNKGSLVVNESSHASGGVLIRHLVMPGFKENSKEIINDLFIDYGSTIYLSLMSQYTPRYADKQYSHLQKTLAQSDYTEVIELTQTLGFTNVYIQDIDSENDQYIPEFNLKKMFDFW